MNLVAARLEELDRRFPDRIAWSIPWQESCAWLAAEARSFGPGLEVDRAGNQWLTLRGERDEAVVVGGRLDVDPGCDRGIESLGVVAGLEVLRRLAANGTQPVTVKLVNWVDGAGVRFGRPFGASAAAGTMRDWFAAAELVDRYGSSLNDVVENAGYMLKLVHMARRLLTGTQAYFELGVEAGSGGPLAVATAAAGVERCRVRWLSTKGGDVRAAADRFAAEVPSVEPVRVESAEAIQLLDLRAHAVDELEQRLDEALEVSDRIATEQRLTVEWKRVWGVPPVEFDTALTELASRTLGAERMPTALQAGAAELARGGFPAALLLLRDEEAVEPAVDALERVVRAAVETVAAR